MDYECIKLLAKYLKTSSELLDKLATEENEKKIKAMFKNISNTINRFSVEK